MMQQHRMCINRPKIVVKPKIDAFAWCSVVYTMFPGNMASHDVMFCGNMTLHWRSQATLYICTHHGMPVGPITI